MANPWDVSNVNAEQAWTKLRHTKLRKAAIRLNDASKQRQRIVNLRKGR